jgi:hypothetical protein
MPTERKSTDTTTDMMKRITGEAASKTVSSVIRIGN